MSIASELARIQSAKTDLASAIVEKGGSIAQGALLDAFAGAVRALPSGGDTSAEDGIITRNISGSYTNARVSSIGSGAFYSCTSLTEVSFPLCNVIATSAFYNCRSLTNVSFPVCDTIGAYAFYSCTSLTNISFPECTTIDNNAFYGCTSLTNVSFPVCTTIGSSAFNVCSFLTSAFFPVCTKISSAAFSKCYNLLSLYLGASTVCSLVASNAFTSTPIAGYTASTDGVYGSIFVPGSLVDAYKSATNWKYFADRIIAIPE